MSARGRSRPGAGNGCLYGLLGLGLLTVVMGLGIEALPDSRRELVEPPPRGSKRRLR